MCLVVKTPLEHSVAFYLSEKRMDKFLTMKFKKLRSKISIESDIFRLCAGKHTFALLVLLIFLMVLYVLFVMFQCNTLSAVLWLLFSFLLVAKMFQTVIAKKDLDGFRNRVSEKVRKESGVWVLKLFKNRNTQLLFLSSILLANRLGLSILGATKFLLFIALFGLGVLFYASNELLYLKSKRLN